MLGGRGSSYGGKGFANVATVATDGRSFVFLSCVDGRNPGTSGSPSGRRCCGCCSRFAANDGRSFVFLSCVGGRNPGTSGSPSGRRCCGCCTRFAANDLRV